MGIWLRQRKWDLFWIDEHFLLNPRVPIVFDIVQSGNIIQGNLCIWDDTKVFWVINNKYKGADKRSHKIGQKCGR